MITVRFLPWLMPILLVVIWQIAGSEGWLSSHILPPPEKVL
ncbi:hypothetical protein [Xenorhabdus hominickii]